ncbi:unnamed protein product [Effrenium voratum]|uniref:THIF-type NAD/FAD binding fold domain-containing protein n=1 Tax=Effrenium voratum TaxID=2562239 RepID=A0AA36IPG7_9DINO|nr:unnamed protein product [Effrenium voratum]
MAEKKTFREFTSVRAFYDMNKHPHGYRYVRLLQAQEDKAAGALIGLSTGWVPATVAEDFSGDGEVLVKMHGHFDDVFEPKPVEDMHWRVHPDLIIPRTAKAASIELSLLVVRWKQYYPGTRASRSHNVLNEDMIKDVLEGAGSLKEALGKGQYEIFTVFASRGEDLDAVPSLVKKMRGKRKAAMYFLWPSQKMEKEGRVKAAALEGLMQRMEADGVKTCWPHPLPLYQDIVSKSWAARECAAPELRIPNTTEVRLSDGSAAQAIEELQALARRQGREPRSKEEYAGVAKLGYAWMGESVIPFVGEENLTRALKKLLDGAEKEAKCLVQERIENVRCEMRAFCCRDYANSEERYAIKLLNIQMKPPTHQTWDPTFRMADHRTWTDDDLARQCFGGDKKLVAKAKAAVLQLTERWMDWFRRNHSEPHVIRMDFMVSVPAPGDFEIHTCELTECGGSTCGLHVAPRTSATLNACLADGDFPEAFPKPLPPFQEERNERDRKTEKPATASTPAASEGLLSTRRVELGVAISALLVLMGPRLKGLRASLAPLLALGLLAAFSARVAARPSSLQMQEAADEALSRALAQASAGLGLDLTSLEAPSHMEPSTQSLGKLPSAVTVAGEPVASTGDMIYLGGGLYACAAPEKPKKKQASRKPPRRPASVMRSASAHIVGPQTESSELSSPQSRAHSEGQIGFANLYSEHRGPSRAGSVVGSSTTAVGPPPGPRVWRPSGVQKLPAAKLEPPAGFGGKASRLSAEDAGKMPGEHAEERAHCRRSSGKEGVMLFGSNGVLAHMRDPSLEQHQAAPPPSGPPKGISKRLEERKAAKQARVEEVLEERALRLATEAAISMQKRQNLAARAKHASAPDLSVEELEKQRQRVACKMEILDFFHGYRNAVHKFTEEQQKVLHANLHGSGLHEASLLRVPFLVSGGHGQKALMDAKVCMLGSSAIATETLKNLVLPGVGHFTVVDGSIVEPADLGQNFFLEEADLGKLRSEAVCRWLLEMNPDVQGTHLDLDPAKAVAQGKEFFRQFTMVIACQMMECLAIQLGKVCEEIGIPLVLATSVGFVGKLRIYASEHCVCETKPDSEFGDLRLNDPFPELRRFADSIDFATLNDSEHAHVPYVVILIRALDTWRSRGEARKLPKTSAEKDEFKAIVSKMRRSPQEANFEEAMANAYKAWMPYVIPDSVQEVLSLVSHAGKSDFWILARAVSQFVRDCGKLPLAGSLPDMTASTDWYIKLQDESHRNSESM